MVIKNPKDFRRRCKNSVSGNKRELGQDSIISKLLTIKYDADKGMTIHPNRQEFYDKHKHLLK